MKKHGIAIREVKTKKLVDFIECDIGKALKVLGGVRINMSKKYYATEEEVTQ